MFDKNEGWEDAYIEDTKGRKYKKSIMTKASVRNKDKESATTQYHLGRRLNRQEFLELPVDLRKLYIERLREAYWVGDARIAEMLGMSISAFSMQLKKIGARAKTRFKPSELRTDAWNAFLDGGAMPEQSQEEVSVIAKQLHLEIVGKLNISAIEKMILVNFDKEDNLRLQITISKEDV